MKILAHIVITALTLILVSEVVPGIEVESLYIALVAALVLALLNAVVKPILFFLTLPVTILTLGLFVFVINALLFAFAASFIEGFTVTGFLPAIVGSLIVSVVSTVVRTLLD